MLSRRIISTRVPKGICAALKPCGAAAEGFSALVAGATGGPYAGALFVAGGFMTTPLDPVIAQIIPLLPLRDPATMTPQSARDALRALAASRAAIPPPPVESAADRQVKGAAGPLAARVYRVSHETSP